MNTATSAATASTAARVPSPAQRAAIDAPLKPLLVVAGPGAGKTYCLIERVRYLIDGLGTAPARICVFTFTNKAAGEIAERLSRELGSRVDAVKRGTIHAFCAELLREFGEHVGLQPGFGIADEAYQRLVLRRLKVPLRMQKSVLDAFARYRFRGEPLGRRYQKVYDGYRRLTSDRNIADFDTLILKTAELFRVPAVGTEARSRWDVVLVDEFQDLNQIQYAVIRELAREHRSIFAVGDDEQSVYSWAGADPRVFHHLRRDFDIADHDVIHLCDNRRCPPTVLDIARRLISANEPMFENRAPQVTTHTSPYPVLAVDFPDDERETSWIIEDLRRDRAAQSGKLGWGDVALLYRTHRIGSSLETAFLNAGIPCCLAQGRALADDKVVAYVLAALRVIANPRDEIQHEMFYQTVLPDALFDSARAWAEETGRSLVQQLEHMARTLPRDHDDRKKIWRGHYALRNLEALGRSHTSLLSLVGDILSEKVGPYRSVLEDNHEDLSDPASHEEVVGLAQRIKECEDTGRPVWLPRVGGAEIAGKRLLMEMGARHVELGGAPSGSALVVKPADFPVLGFGLGLFKTAQLVRAGSFSGSFRDFTAIDLETTDNDVRRAEIVEIAAVRVRHGRVVDEFHTLVKPNVPITAGALGAHGISEANVADAPTFEMTWQRFRDFCGNDILVAHNGYRFDFPVLRRMAARLPRGSDFSTYDTLPLARSLYATSCSLPNLAKRYGIQPGRSHRALDDARTLARLFPALNDSRVEYGRKTSLAGLLDHLGIALALSDGDSLCEEARKFLDWAPPFTLGRHSDCLDCYRADREQCGDQSLPTVDEVITFLGGHSLMERLRAERSATSRYPETMARLRRLIDACANGELPTQICAFLERAVLSRYDGAETEHNRVNLLTMHSTKGLEFSRVYIVGVEDEQLIPVPRDGVLGKQELEEARRLLYVGMTRTRDRLVMTRTRTRGDKPTGGHRFLDEMGINPRTPLA